MSHQLNTASRVDLKRTCLVKFVTQIKLKRKKSSRQAGKRSCFVSFLAFFLEKKKTTEKLIDFLIFYILLLGGDVALALQPTVHSMGQISRIVHLNCGI